MSVKVILVDDHKIMLEGLRTIIGAHKGFEVIGEAGNGRDAIKMSQKLNPDVIVMDLSMPDLNGIEATGEIVSSNPYIKVIALSMHSDKRFVTRALKAGASGYVLKESASDELIQAIQSIMSGRMYLSPKIEHMVLSDYRQMLTGETTTGNGLTNRELEVLQMLAEGNSTRQIAEALSLSTKTIETHRSQLMDKLEMRTIAELTKYAIREGLTRLD